MERAPRNQAIETLRIIAAFGIVAYHSGAAFHEISYAGLIVFLILSPMMDALYNWGKRRNIREIAISLLLPWLFWMMVYGARNLVFLGSLFPPGSIVGGILLGTSAHLWFLPFIFLVRLGLDALKFINRPTITFWFCAIGSAATLATAPLWRDLSLTWPSPLPQWMHGSAAVLIGVTLGLHARVGKGGWIGLCLLLTGLLIALKAGLPGVGIPYTVGLCAVMLAHFLPSKWLPENWNVQPMANCMMGVYLTHILFLQISIKLIGQHTIMPY